MACVFNAIPVICKINGRENLREGAIYTRSRRIPETVKVPTHSEMREIINIATEKKIRSFLEMAQQARLRVEVGAEVDDYDRQLEEIDVL